jgi:hypothetical protein
VRLRLFSPFIKVTLIQVFIEINIHGQISTL